MGIKIDPNNHDRDLLRNYIISTIKHDFQKTIDSLVKNNQEFLKNDVHMKYKMATHSNSLDKFSSMYLSGNILGSVHDDNMLVFQDFL